MSSLRQILLWCCLVSLVLANNPISNDTFNSNIMQAAAAAAPLWLLPVHTCFPSSAVWNGQKDPGNAPDDCNIAKLNHGCPVQPAFSQAYTHAHDFPTYVIGLYCRDLNQWRILYDVYFTKDTGHRYDWEWAVVIFRQWGNTDSYIRDSVVLEQDGDKKYSSWTDIPETFVSNIRESTKEADHAKLYISKFHHSVHLDDYRFFEVTCTAPHPSQDYRKNDYYYFAADWLEDGNTVPGAGNWGQADSFPVAFNAGGSHNLCWNI